MSDQPIKPQPWMIEILSGVDRGKKYMISRPSVKIGRDTANHIVLNDLKVSRNHIQFEVADGKVYLINHSPHNPVTIDGQSVQKCVYLPGQVLIFGETSLVLKRQESLPATPRGANLGAASSGISNPNGSPAQPKPQRTLLYAIVGLVLMGAFLFNSDQKKNTEEDFEVTSTADIEKLVLESRERQRELKQKRSFASVPERKGFEAAERLYNQGFRDFQRGNYSRAIQSFRASLASDRKHSLAQRYLRLSMRKQEERIDQSLLEGRRHYEKGMYSLCEATMAKVLVMIDDKDELKYQQADELRHECFLNKTVM